MNKTLESSPYSKHMPVVSSPTLTTAPPSASQQQPETVLPSPVVCPPPLGSEGTSFIVRIEVHMEKVSFTTLGTFIRVRAVSSLEAQKALASSHTQAHLSAVDMGFSLQRGFSIHGRQGIAPGFFCMTLSFTEGISFAGRSSRAHRGGKPTLGAECPSCGLAYLLEEGQAAGEAQRTRSDPVPEGSRGGADR